MTNWWATLTRLQRIVVAIVAVLFGFNVALAGMNSAMGSGSSSGPDGSSFSTAPSGIEGLADLARASGHEVVKLKEPPEPGSLPIDATVIVTDPRQMTTPEARAVLDFVAGGGRLVVSDPTALPLVEAATGLALTTTQVDPQTSLDVLADADRADEVTGSARSIAGDRGLRWSAEDQLGDLDGVAVHVVGSGEEATVVSVEVGDGLLIAIADSVVLHNDHLADADNAALGLSLVGPPDRPVIFIESIHGFAVGGLDAVPTSWKWAGAGAVAALAVGIWWAAARFGPAEPQARELRPPRLDHVRAVAANIDRVSHSPEELVAPLVIANRQAMAHRLGTSPDDSPAVHERAARDSGLDPADIVLAFDGPVDMGSALAVGQMAAARRRVELETTQPQTPR